MAQSTIIEVTVDYAGSTYLGGVSKGLDVQNIVSPPYVNDAGLTVIRYMEAGSYSIKQNEPVAVIEYQVQESLADIALVGEGMVVLTVEKIGRTADINTTLPTATSYLFDVNKFGSRVDVIGSGCGFLYREYGAADPIFYQVSESLSAIIAAVPIGPPNVLTGVLNSPYIPYAASAFTLADSTIYFTSADSTLRLGAGSSIGSQIAGESMINFGPGGDEFNFSTDNGGYAEGYITSSQALSQIGVGSSLVSVTPLANTIFNATQTVIDSPDVVLYQGVLNSNVPSTGRLDFSATGNEVILSTDGGALAESYLHLTSLRALIGDASGSGLILDSATGIAELKGSASVYFNTPIVTFTDGAVINIDTTPGGIISLFNGTGDIVNFGAAGGTINVSSTMAMEAAQLQLAASTVSMASATIAAGVAPAAPASGEIYSDGTHLYWVDGTNTPKQLDN